MCEVHHKNGDNGGMSAHAQAKITAEEYLDRERAADSRSEFYGGYVYAMSGGTWAHATLISNVARRLGNALDGTPCGVSSSDMRLEVAPRTMYTYPDVMVICGEPRFVDARKDAVTNPTVIVEVLSPSTEAYDRGFKAQQYRAIESLQEYALISQDQPRVEVYRRREGQWWLKDVVGLESSCRFESVNAAIPLSEIYDRISFEALAGPPRE